MSFHYTGFRLKFVDPLRGNKACMKHLSDTTSSATRNSPEAILVLLQNVSPAKPIPRGGLTNKGILLKFDLMSRKVMIPLHRDQAMESMGGTRREERSLVFNFRSENSYYDKKASKYRHLSKAC